MVGVVAACLALTGAAAPARADDPPPPDLSGSTLSCTPENAGPVSPGTTRPGDFVVCHLQVNVAGSTAYDVTADISIPAGTRYAPIDENAHGTPLPAGAPTRVFFGETDLGLVNPGLPKPATVRLQVTDAVSPGQSIGPVATVYDDVAPTATIASNFIAAMPRIADLHRSGTTCANVDPARGGVRAGETVECRFQLVNEPDREDATGVSVVAAIPGGLRWIPGGNEAAVFPAELQWFGPVLAGGVPSGGSAPPLRFRAVVDPALPGGASILVGGTAGWVNALSLSIDRQMLTPAVIHVQPGPAVLAGSTLACSDADAAPLLAGDLVECTIAVRPAAGHEDLASAAAAADVPDHAQALGATDRDGRVPAGGLLGTVGAGQTGVARYQLRVSPAAAPGTAIVPTALITGTSVPSGTPVSVRVQGAALVVGSRPAPATADGASSPARTSAASAAAAKPSSRTPAICASRRVVTVNVRPPKGRRWKAVTFSFAKTSAKGKKATGALGRKGYFRARLVFQGLPKGPLTVTIKGVTTRGRTVRSFRTYNLCAKKR
jgi:hypothetical protein